MSEEWVIDIIATRCAEECGWSQSSTPFNQAAWVDVITYLFLEKGLSGPLIDAYRPEIFAARIDAQRDRIDAEGDR